MSWNVEAYRLFFDTEILIIDYIFRHRSPLRIPQDDMYIAYETSTQYNFLHLIPSKFRICHFQLTLGLFFLILVLNHI